MPNDELDYGCLFCMTGREHRIAEVLGEKNPDAFLFVPEKLRLRREMGVAHEERVILFPGYVFFSVPKGGELKRLHVEKLACRLLGEADDEWRLQGSDRLLVEKLRREEGLIGFSKAWYEGDRIRIQEGFLKEYEGNIIRVNRRARTAQVEIDFQGKKVSAWLGFELMADGAPPQVQE